MDALDSISVADSIIERVIHKVAHIQYMKDIEKMVKPYVIGYTQAQHVCI